MLPGTCEAVVT